MRWAKFLTWRAVTSRLHSRCSLVPQRAASVTLKERRTLVVVVRETPLSGQTLKHMVALDEAGAVVLPASPAFYAGATHIQDLVDFVAGRVLDAAGVEHGLYRRWEGELGGGSRRS